MTYRDSYADLLHSPKMPFREAAEKLAEACREKDRMIADLRAENTRLRYRAFRSSSELSNLARKVIQGL